MDIATPKPDTPKPKFKLNGGTPPPANAKHGDHPQQGVGEWRSSRGEDHGHAGARLTLE